MTSASGWLKMSSTDENLRNSEMGEVWARMNRTLTFGGGLGSLGSRRREQGLCVPPSVASHSPPRAPLPLPFLHWNTMMVLSTRTPPQAPSRRHTLPTRKALLSSLRVGSLSFPRSQHPAACWHVVGTQKCLLSEWVSRCWLEQRRVRWG